MNPRIVKEADALAEVGHDVQVISADFSSWARSADSEFLDREWAKLSRLRFGPDAPWATRIRQVATNKAAKFAARIGATGLPISVAAQHPLAVDLLKAAAKTRADLYVAHYVAALPAAANAARLHAAMYAFDAEDFHPGDYPDRSEYDVERGIITRIEEKFLPNCAYVTAASAGIAEAYSEKYKISRPSVILNVFPKSQAPEAPSATGRPSLSPSVYWFSQTIGANRGLECAVRAAAIAKSKPHLYLRGICATGFADRLNRLATELGVSERLHILAPGMPEEMVRLASCFDMGLVGETGETRNRQIALTNKQFTYILAGLPVAMSDVSAHTTFAKGLEDFVQLYQTDEPASLAQAMDRWLLDKDALALARERAWAFGQTTFNWDIEKQKLTGLVARSTAGR